jgi:hypothetical protein
MTTATGRARPRKQRAQMGGIRAFWTGLLTFGSYALEAGVGYLANFDILGQWFSWPIAVGLGMTMYGAKRYWFPDTRW